MFLLFFGQLLKNRAAARVLRDARRARIELEPAALGRDRDTQRVARENHLRRPALRIGRLAGLTVFARAVNLHHALLADELPRRRDFFDQRFDVGAEELEGLVAGLADQVEVARVPIRMLEPEAAFAEIDFAGDARVHHPLQRAVHRRAADASIFLADEIDEIVRAEVPLLAQERIDDEIALAGALAASRAHAFDINGSACTSGSGQGRSLNPERCSSG